MKFLDFTNIFIYDVEVFKHHWSVSIKSHHSGKRWFFEESSTDQYLGSQGLELKKLLDAANPILVGFNNTHYDNHILALIVNGYKPHQIKELNDYIINEGEQAWTWDKYPPRYYFPYNYTDLMDDLSERMSLKMYEANKGMSIVESSVDFNLDRPLTEAEKLENKEYNEIDVDATESLMLDRMRYLNTKIELGTHANLTPEKAVSMTNAKLVASYLVGNEKPITNWGDEFDYEIPENIEIRDKRIIQYFENMVDTTPKCDIMIAGVPHVLAQGGIHGSDDKSIHVSDSEWQVQLADGDQYYPSIIVNYKYQSRAMKRPELYDDSVKQRGIYKAAKDPRQEPFKLTNNTAYGAMNNKYNALNDPLMANSTCFTGQLLLIDLVEKLEEGLGDDFQSIQSNTDGIVYKYRKNRQEDLDKITSEWEKRVHIKLDFENIDKLVQSNVNNYVMMDDRGNVTAKGAQLKAFHGRNWEDGHLAIIAKAMGEYFLYGTPPEKTINSATDILDFQMLLRNGRAFDYGYAETPHGDQPIQRVNRVYASKDKRYGELYKCKSDGSKTRMPTCPPHAIVDNGNELTLDDIDKQFYIDLANERILKYIGGGNDLEELGKLADRITRLEMNGKVLEVKKGSYIPKEWSNANVITLKRYREILERQEEDTVEVNFSEMTSEEVDKHLDDKIENIKAEGRTLADKLKGTPEEVHMDHIKGPEVKEVEMEVDVEVSAEVKDKVSNEVKLLQKIHKLRGLIMNNRWIKDGQNDNQKYKFISADMVKKITNPMLFELGLEMIVQITDSEYIENPSNSMHITMVHGRVTLMDIETGTGMDYHSVSQGADGGDKGIFKARTGLVKYFWFDNFGIATMDDAEFDEYTKVIETKTDNSDLTPVQTGWIPQDIREQAKVEAIKDTTPAKEENVQVLRDLYNEYAPKELPEHIEILNKILTTMQNKPTDTQAVELIMEATDVLR